MSKIICDLCGSTYPEDADRCPVCGTAKTEAPVQQEEKPAARRRRPQKKSFVQKIKDGCLFVVESARANLGLAIAVLLLVLAIIAVCIFIAVSLNEEKPGPNPDSSSSSSSSSQTNVPCTAITLPSEQASILLDSESTTFRLTPAVLPADTTDKVTYESSDPAVATVDANGVVTAVANGQVTITVTCGGFRTQCTVLCQPEPLVPPVEMLKLNREDIMLDGYGDSWNLADRLYGYTGPEATEVTWTSADPAVVSVENGKVTALANSTAGVVITAEYEDQKVTCLVRCTNVVPPTEEKYEWNHPGYNGVPDVTVSPGWTYKLQLIDKETGEPVDVTLTVKDETVCIINEDGKVEALENTSGKVRVTTITAEIDGEVYKFTIRVKSTETEEEA